MCPPDSKIKYSLFYVCLWSCIIILCYFTCIFYAVVRQNSMLFMDNKDSVFCKSKKNERFCLAESLPEETTATATTTTITVMMESSYRAHIFNKTMSQDASMHHSCARERTHTHTRARTHTHTRTHARTHARSHARTHARPQTHTARFSQSGPEKTVSPGKLHLFTSNIGVTSLTDRLYVEYSCYTSDRLYL